MKVTFLGTGTSAGIPVLTCSCPVCCSRDPRDRRLRCSVMVEWPDTVLVIDAGPDFRHQMLRAAPSTLDAVLFTHEHKDHIAGLDDIRPYNFLQGKKIDVYASPRVEAALRREYHYIFSDDGYPGIPEINLCRIGLEEFDVKGHTVMPVQVYHHQLPVLGFRLGPFAYITDANRIEESELEKLKGLDVLVLNALRRTPHLSHFSLQEALQMAGRIGAKTTFFTHISHQMGLHAEVSAELPPNMELAYDGLKLEWIGEKFFIRHPTTAMPCE
ncbi:MAG: MBL fold metallo-hydrolase [Flavobacteriales bacterium]|nr:MBL fold metallo-hydrolase [Flavobacteriales bacterium]MCX7649117.1 MBL fold metallo-hydrolase [Flavobacteriales bacterium]MDW8432035.1 MBL fold metallo-hydrolase [Flavobacteriales bacterium]